MPTRPEAALAFRANFPALDRFSWFDTPGSPPGARPVTEAIRTAVESWASGDFSWLDWDEIPDLAREKLAGLLAVDPKQVALVGSLSEAAATVADAVPSGGTVLVAADEFRSNLLPWLALERRAVHIALAPPGDTASLTDRICAGIVAGVSLVAVSSAVSATGARPDLGAIVRRAREVGARVFINVTQSYGVLRLDLKELDPDYVAAHAYKWMLAPRGCAWLYARTDRLDELHPLAPGWHSVDDPRRDYNGARALSAEARRLDGPLPWLSWIGGSAALDLLLEQVPGEVEAQALGLARAARDGLEGLGIQLEGEDQPSHIVRLYSPRSTEILARLRQDDVVASGNAQGLRIGVHGFNTRSDVDRFLAGVAHVLAN